MNDEGQCPTEREKLDRKYSVLSMRQCMVAIKMCLPDQSLIQNLTTCTLYKVGVSAKQLTMFDQNL